MTSTRRTSLTAACVAGLLSLTACGGGSNTEAFCDFVENADSRFESVVLAPSNEAIVAGAEGDMSGINAWGEDSAGNLDELIGELRDAESNAPTEASADALGVMANAISTMKDVSDLAASSDDIDIFFDEAEALYVSIDEEILAAGDIEAPIDEAEAEYCG